MATNQEIIQLLLDMGVSAQNVEKVTTELERLNIQLHKTEAAAEKATTSTRNMGYAGLTAGRAIQDFAQGGIGGILNNIEGLVMSLGGPAGLAGVLTAVGVAAFIAKPFIMEFWNSMSDGANKIPESTDNLQKMNDEIKRNREELDKLKEKQSLSNDELARFNELTEKQTGLEKAAAAEKKMRAEEAKMMELKPAGEAEAIAERAKIVSGEIGGEQEDLISRIASTLAEPVRTAIEDEMAALWKPGTPFGDLPAKSRERYEALAKRQAQLQTSPEFMDQARRMITQATMGDEGALQAVINRLPGGKLKQGLMAAQPEALAAYDAEAAEFDAGNKRAHEARLEREKQAKIKRASEKKRQAEEDKIDDAVEDFEKAGERIVGGARRAREHADVQALRNANRRTIQQADKAKRQADQAIDDFMEMMRENGNVFDGVMYSTEQLRTMAYWGKRQAAEQAERIKSTVMGGGDN